MPHVSAECARVEADVARSKGRIRDEVLQAVQQRGVPGGPQLSHQPVVVVTVSTHQLVVCGGEGASIEEPWVLVSRQIPNPITQDLGVACVAQQEPQPLQLGPQRLGPIAVEHRAKRGEGAAEPPNGDPHLVDRVLDVSSHQYVPPRQAGHEVAEASPDDLTGKLMSPVVLPGSAHLDFHLIARHVSVVLHRGDLGTDATEHDTV